MKGMCVLIDTWWNVNKALNAALCITDRVLIDTWWNVNFSVTFVHFPDASVLIDTWWNVNELVIEHHNLDEDSFNRYMVECEFFNLLQIPFPCTVLIDTWWNVNYER